MSTIFALVDCDAFYCSCEALFHRAAASRPAIVLGNNDGCVVARNRLARALTIKVGTPLFQIRALVERFHVLVYSSNYALYADVSRRVMMVLSRFSEQIEQYSIDEVWLDLSHVPPQELTGYGHLIRTQIEQRREALRIAIVRRGRKKKLMLKVGCDTAQGLRAQRIGGVAATARRCDVVRFVENEQVEAARADRLARPGQRFAKEAQRPVALEKVNRGNQAREVRPGVDVQATLAAQAPEQVAIDDAKLQAEFVAHLVAPLHLQGGGADH